MINEPYSVMTATRAVADYQEREHREKIKKMSPEERLEMLLEIIEAHPEIFPPEKCKELLEMKLDELP